MFNLLDPHWNIPKLRFKYFEGEKSTGTTVINQTTTPELTDAERELQELELERQRAVQPGQIETQTTGLNLVNLLLSGEEPLPGFFQELSQGISPEITESIVQESLRDIAPQFQSVGILDSGVAASVSGRIAGDIRRGTEEFNIGNRFNLLNLALSGQAQVQQPLLAQSQILSSRIAGLRPVTTQGTTTARTQSNQNPFLNAAFSSFGQGVGAAAGTAAGAAFFSSIDYKKNVTKNTIDSIAVLDDIDVVEFDYKENVVDNKHHIGFILEDSPELIRSEDGQTVDMVNMIGVLVDSNKKLLERVRALEKGVE